MFNRTLILLIFSILLFSCERVIDIDLNSVSPLLVAEANLYKDSVTQVRLTYSTDYFSIDKSVFVENAIVKISDGILEEELSYTGNGYYRGNSITGMERGVYNMEITSDGKIYSSVSVMPLKTVITSVWYGVSNEQSILNPSGKTVVTVSCEFYDDPLTENYYMIYYISDGRMIEDRYFMLTEKNANGGSFTNSNNILSFSESIFYEGKELEIRLYSIDKSVYTYFYQLDDILFWKRRVIPPTPYNPESNISNGILGYFAAWTYDSKKILIN